jgi:uncharacterized membrane protein
MTVRSAAPVTTAAPTANVTAATHRIDAIDAVRGLVILLMVVDHARDYANGPRVADPMDLDATPTLLFWMRWAAHFCAPVFTFLAGVSAALQLGRMERHAAARHQVTRGLVLIGLEFTIIHFAWTFSTVWPMLYAQVIWALGLSMIALGAAQYLPARLRLFLGLAIVVGHNLLDGWHPTSPPALHWLWAILHDRQVMPLWEGLSVRTSYPVLPMIGLMLVGEAAGRWYQQIGSGPTRQRALRSAGVGLILLFALLRSTNLYGDLHAAPYVGAFGHDFLSLLNATKYPMSLAFMLMTIGPTLLLLAAWDDGVPRPLAFLTLPGRVPMFLYIAHLYLLHLLAMLWALGSGFRWADFDFTATIGGVPKAFGFDLWLTIPFAAVTIVLLWPAAGWYARLRASRRYRFTRYI